SSALEIEVPKVEERTPLFQESPVPAIEESMERPEVVLRPELEASEIKTLSPEVVRPAPVLTEKTLAVNERPSPAAEEAIARPPALRARPELVSRTMVNSSEPAPAKPRPELAFKRSMVMVGS